MSFKSKCRYCGAPVLWAITSTGKRMCVDPEENAQGNVILRHRRDDDGRPYLSARVMPVGTMLAEGEKRRMVHKASCPHFVKPEARQYQLGESRKRRHHDYCTRCGGPTSGGGPTCDMCPGPGF